MCVYTCYCWQGKNVCVCIHAIVGKEKMYARVYMLLLARKKCMRVYTCYCWQGKNVCACIHAIVGKVKMYARVYMLLLAR